MRFFLCLLATSALVLSPLANAESETLKGYSVDDATSGKVRSALERDQMLSALNIRVKADDLGAVHLSGTAKSQAEVSQAASVARSVSGVVSVQNDIVIDGPNSDIKNEDINHEDRRKR